MKAISFLMAALFVQGCAVPVSKSWTGDVSPTKQKISAILAEGKPVKIALFNDRAASTPHILTELEVDYLDTFSMKKNFTLVERSYLDQILSEHNLNLTGAVNYQDVAKLGELAGITHLIFWSVATQPYRGWIVSLKMVEIESGAILTSQWSSDR